MRGSSELTGLRPRVSCIHSTRHDTSVNVLNAVPSNEVNGWVCRGVSHLRRCVTHCAYPRCDICGSLGRSAIVHGVTDQHVLIAVDSHESPDCVVMTGP